MTQVTKIFKSGNSQAVRLPKEFRFNVAEVEVTREGEAIILRPHIGKKPFWSALRAALQRGFSPDFMEQGREQPEQKRRPDLDETFK
jgi:antitoxin VapB